MAEESGWCKLQDVATFLGFGSIHMIVTGGTTVSAQNTAGAHVKEEFTRNQQQQADIEQVTIKLDVMRNELAAQAAEEAKTSKCSEKFAHIIEKKDSHKKFYEQFGKFLKHAIHEDSRPIRQRLPSWCGSAIRSL